MLKAQSFPCKGLPVCFAVGYEDENQCRCACDRNHPCGQNELAHRHALADFHEMDRRITQRGSR